MEQFSDVQDGDRARILMEHQQYLNGQRSAHADFSTARKQTPQTEGNTARLAPTNRKRRAVYARQQTLGSVD
ncbi:hypothetical protein DVH05_016542 [Phytophthora capsici]|nr:hypothetical protein DVH05_016542 [Phytophthora capsici]